MGLFSLSCDHSPTHPCCNQISLLFLSAIVVDMFKWKLFWLESELVLKGLCERETVWFLHCFVCSRPCKGKNSFENFAFKNSKINFWEKKSKLTAERQGHLIFRILTMNSAGEIQSYFCLIAHSVVIQLVAQATDNFLILEVGNVLQQFVIWL